MSRSGSVDDRCDNWALIRWRGAVRQAIRGRRGQALLKEMLIALDALPQKRLIDGELVVDGAHGGVIIGADELVIEDRGGIQWGYFGEVSRPVETCRVGDVCALGAVGRARDMIEIGDIDPHDPAQVSAAFNIANALAREIVYINDEGSVSPETPEQRFVRVRKWIASQIIDASEKSYSDREDRGLPHSTEE